MMPNAGASIEDYVPGGPELYLEAVARYSAKVAEQDANKVRSLIVQELGQEGQTPNSAAFGFASRVIVAAQKTTKLAEKPSKLGIAREYQLLLEEKGDYSAVGSLTRASNVASRILAQMKLPSQTLAQDKIIQ
jgi:hypothetical protein